MYQQISDAIFSIGSNPAIYLILRLFAFYILVTKREYRKMKKEEKISQMIAIAIPFHLEFTIFLLIVGFLIGSSIHFIGKTCRFANKKLEKLDSKLVAYWRRDEKEKKNPKYLSTYKAKYEEQVKYYEPKKDSIFHPDSPFQKQRAIDIYNEYKKNEKNKREKSLIQDSEISKLEHSS